MYIEYNFKKSGAIFFDNLLNFAEVFALALWIFLMQGETLYYYGIAILVGCLISNAIYDTKSLKKFFKVVDNKISYYYRGKNVEESLDKLEDVKFYGEESGQHLMKLTFKNDEDGYKIKSLDLAKMNQYDRRRVKDYFTKLGLVK